MKKLTPSDIRAKRYWGTQTVQSTRGRLELDDAWDVICEDYDQTYKPDLWMNLDTIRPMDKNKASQLIRKFFTKLCREHDTHCRVHTFRDVQKNSKFDDKYDNHCIVSWIGKSVSIEDVIKSWLNFADKQIFKVKPNRLSVGDVVTRKYSIDIQDYKERTREVKILHPLRYASDGHEWSEVYVACSGKKKCRRRGCVHSHEATKQQGKLTR